MNLYSILSPWASTESRGIAPLIPLRPFSGITPTHLLPVGVKKRWGNPHILRYMFRDAFDCLSREEIVTPTASE
jgi:hypothetical protein